MSEKAYMKNHDIVTRKIAGELFLVPIRGTLADMQNIFTLNRIGEYIWQALDTRKHIEEICDGVISSFNVGKEQAYADVADFIFELMRADLIREQ